MSFYERDLEISVYNHIKTFPYLTTINIDHHQLIFLKTKITISDEVQLLALPSRWQGTT
jgi:hypothetical protein